MVGRLAGSFAVVVTLVGCGRIGPGAATGRPAYDVTEGGPYTETGSPGGVPATSSPTSGNPNDPGGQQTQDDARMREVIRQNCVNNHTGC